MTVWQAMSMQSLGSRKQEHSDVQLSNCLASLTKQLNALSEVDRGSPVVPCASAHDRSSTPISTMYSILRTPRTEAFREVAGVGGVSVPWISAAPGGGDIDL